MVVGVFCEKNRKCISFEECANCAQCLPAPIIRSLRIYDSKKPRNVYFVREVVSCLRKAYFERKEPPKDHFYKMRELISIKRGKLFGGMASSAHWQELPGSIDYEIDGEKLKLTGRLDIYDPDNLEITEIKSRKIFEDSRLPKKKDVLQLQCYGTIFKGIFRVQKLNIVYFDMDTCQQYSVPFDDKSIWLKKRIHILHRAVRDSKPPKQEQSFKCRYCSFKEKCALMIKDESHGNGLKIHKSDKTNWTN